MDIWGIWISKEKYEIKSHHRMRYNEEEFTSKRLLCVVCLLQASLASPTTGAVSGLFQMCRVMQCNALLLW